jgi:UV DNA damage endonuclease
VIVRLGYACIPLDGGGQSGRTCRLAGATPDRLRALIAGNLDGLAATLRYNRSLDVRLFRITSQLIPFASHPVNTLRWWEEFAAPLTAIGAYARAEGMRLSFHPGQYTALSSPRPEVVAAAERDLAAAARVLEAMGLGQAHKIVVHGGGTYGDPAAALARFAAVYRGLPERVARHVVLENDERAYAAADVLAVHERCGVPIVFDALHDAVNPGPAPTPDPGDPAAGRAARAARLAACLRTWREADGRPKTHFSSQDGRKQRGAHAEYVDAAAFRAFAADTAETAVDCMLEAKAKERALLRLRADLAVLAPLDGAAAGAPLLAARA